MAGSYGGVKTLWDAGIRREKVWKAHPRLKELEEQVARALQLHVFGQCSKTEVERAIAARLAYLQQYGIPQDYAEPKWQCTHCQDEGYVDGTLCSCRQQAELDAMIRNSGLPIKLRGQTFDKFELKWYSEKRKALGKSERQWAAYALQCCQGFVASILEGVNRQGLFISGEVGLGKTFLLSAMCNSLIEARVPTMYVVFSDLIAAIKDSFNNEGSAHTESRIMAAAKDARVLILDDLGAEQVTEFVTNRLFDILNYRCNHNKPLVVSSNLSSQQIGDLYGKRIASRLWEMCELVLLYGEDIRWQKQRQG